MKTALRLFPAFAIAFGSAQSLRADDIDDYIRAEMRLRRISGVSLAIVDGGRIVQERYYGVTEAGGKKPVTKATLFQAGWTSKFVSTLGFLRLIQQKSLPLETPAVKLITSFTLPASSRPSRQFALPLSRLLTISSPNSVSYAAGEKAPTALQILQSYAQAATQPAPSTYNGEHCTILQQILEDVDGRSFAKYMQEEIFEPLGMSHSAYEQPLPEPLQAFAAQGRSETGEPIPGKWRIYPESAAIGLWTTSSDMARAIIEAQRALAGSSNKILSAETAKMLLSSGRFYSGYGVNLAGEGESQRFYLRGATEGFRAHLVGYVRTGKGAVVMMNGSPDAPRIERIFTKIAAAFNWKDYPDLRKYTPIPDAKPEFTKRIFDFLLQFQKGAVDLTTIHPQFHEQYSPNSGNLGFKMLRDLGTLRKIELITRENDSNPVGVYMYRADFEAEPYYISCTIADGKIGSLYFEPY